MKITAMIPIKYIVYAASAESYKCFKNVNLQSAAETNESRRDDDDGG